MGCRKGDVILFKGCVGFAIFFILIGILRCELALNEG